MINRKDRVFKTGQEIRDKLLDAIAYPNKREGVSLELLESMLANIEKIVCSSELPRPVSQGKVLTRIIVDSWPMGNELGKDITDWESLYLGS